MYNIFLTGPFVIYLGHSLDLAASVCDAALTDVTTKNATEPRVKISRCEKCIEPPRNFATDRSQAMIPMLFIVYGFVAPFYGVSSRLCLG